MSDLEDIIMDELNVSVLAGSVYDTWEDGTLLYSLCDEDIKEFMDDYNIIKKILITHTHAFMNGKNINVRIIDNLNYVYTHLQSIYEGTCIEYENHPEYTWNRSMFAIME